MDVKRYSVGAYYDEPRPGGVSMVMASDYDALRQRLAAAEGLLRRKHELHGKPHADEWVDGGTTYRLALRLWLDIDAFLSAAPAGEKESGSCTHVIHDGRHCSMCGASITPSQPSAATENPEAMYSPVAREGHAGASARQIDVAAGDQLVAGQPERCCLDYPRCDCNSPPEPDNEWHCSQYPGCECFAGCREKALEAAP